MSKFLIGSDKLWGKYRAEVLKNDDPLKRGRVLVKCSSVLPDVPELGWAESCLMPGHFFLPRVGDYVWIEFEGGDVNLPIWVGIMPTRQYVKDYLMSGYGDRVNYDKDVSVIRSKLHQGIHFRDNDIKGKKELEIKDEAGSKVLMNSVNGTLTLYADHEINGTHVSEPKINNNNGQSGRSSPGTPKSPTPMEVENH